jgi:redox-sensitive bicupin YhaK (pirin superfamily)
MKIKHFRAADRGKSFLGWLESYFTFSFAQYRNPDKLHVGPLRVLNDDTIQPMSGFGTHPHRDMEIITIVTQGEITHKDSTGADDVTRPGEIQIMSAGTGVAHSEKNEHPTDVCHLFQIWIIPDEMNLTPSYQKAPIQFGQNTFHEIIGPEAELSIHQDASLHLAEFSEETQLTYELQRSGVFLFVMEGALKVNSADLRERDGVEISSVDHIEMTSSNAKVLLFDLDTEGFNLT